MMPLKDEDVLDLVGKQDRLYFAPGSQFRYSNTGYALLALIVEKVSGQSFAQFLEKNIFDPLELAGTVAYEEGISKVAREPTGTARRPAVTRAPTRASPVRYWRAAASTRRSRTCGVGTRPLSAYARPALVARFSLRDRQCPEVAAKKLA